MANIAFSNLPTFNRRLSLVSKGSQVLTTRLNSAVHGPPFPISISRSGSCKVRRQWRVSAIIASAGADHVAGDWPVPESGKSPLKPALPRCSSPLTSFASRLAADPGALSETFRRPGDQYRRTRHHGDVAAYSLTVMRSVPRRHFVTRAR